MKKSIIILTAIGLLLLGGAAAHAQYYLGVISGEARKIPLVVLDISDDAGTPELRKLALEVLRADLRRSQIFELADPKELDLIYDAKTEPPRETVMRAGTFGMTGVVWAQLHRKGADLVLSGRLFDASTGLRMSSKDFFGNKDTVRRMAHAFADEIVLRFTGEKGMAGTRIAFVSDKTGDKELYVMDYDGANPLKISADRSLCMSPAWSPDGKTLAYVSYRDGNPDLFALDLDTGRRWKISGGEGLNISPAWQAAGCRAQQGRRCGDLYDGPSRTGAGPAYLRRIGQCGALLVPERTGDRLYLGQGRHTPDLYHEC